MPLARTTDPDTSHEAAASLDDPQIRASQEAVLTVLAAIGPSTDHVLARYYERAVQCGIDIPFQSPSGLRTRRKELTRMGRIVDSGIRDVTPSGRRAIVWVAR